MIAYQSEQSLISDTLRYRLPNGEDKERLIGMYKGYIYRHWLINDKGIEQSYIGQTIQNIKQRWGNDGSNYTKGEQNHKFARAINKYGWDAFTHEIIGIVEAETEEQLKADLNEWEIYYIDYYNSFYNEYNSNTGGNGYIVTDEIRQKRSERMMGENNPMYGKECSDKRKEKISKALKGKMSGENHWNYGKHESEETKQKMSKSQKYLYEQGYINPNKDKPMSEEQKEKISNSRKGKYCGKDNPNAKAVICLNTLEIFDSGIDAQNWCNISNKAILKCCRGNSKTSGKHPITGEKLHWMYYKDYLKFQEQN